MEVHCQILFSLEFCVLQIFFLVYHMSPCMTLMLSAQQQENMSFCQSPIYYSGPPKSIEAVSQAVSGIVDDLTGSCLCSTVAIWHW